MDEATSMNNVYSLARRVIIAVVLILLSPLLRVSIAQVSLQSTRHFEGTRFLVVSEAKVYANPRTDSRIVSDIRRWTMIYAVKTPDPGWLSMRGSGTRPYPDSYQRPQVEKLTVTGGRFNLSADRLDRDNYRPV